MNIKNKYTSLAALIIINIIFSVMALEFFSSFIAPSWPNRDIRTSGALFSQKKQTKTFLDYYPWWYLPTNSWGMRDFERSVAKVSKIKRVVFVGDSFLEGGFAHYPLSLLIEKKLFSEGVSTEMVNLGVSATDPKQYFYRIKNVGLALKPDLLVVLIYSGNDFMPNDEKFDTSWRTIFSDPLSLLSALPRFQWVFNSIMANYKARKISIEPVEELDILFRASQNSYEEGVRALAGHAYKYYNEKRGLSEAQLADILGRGGKSVWDASRGSATEPEIMQGWIIDNLFLWETSTGNIVRSSEEAQSMLPPNDIEATVSWIKAISEIARNANVPVLFVQAPVAIVDPASQKYWSNWPRNNQFNYIADARHERLSRWFKEEKYDYIDLRSSLNGVPGTYRLTDQHWTDKGHDIVSNELIRYLKLSYPQLIAR